MGLTFVLEDAEKVRLLFVIVFGCSAHVFAVSDGVVADLANVVVGAREGVASVARVFVSHVGGACLDKLVRRLNRKSQLYLLTLILFTYLYLSVIDITQARVEVAEGLKAVSHFCRPHHASRFLLDLDHTASELFFSALVVKRAPGL